MLEVMTNPGWLAIAPFLCVSWLSVNPPHLHLLNNASSELRKWRRLLLRSETQETEILQNDNNSVTKQDEITLEYFVSSHFS